MLMIHAMNVMGRTGKAAHWKRLWRKSAWKSKTSRTQPCWAHGRACKWPPLVSIGPHLLQECQGGLSAHPFLQGTLWSRDWWNSSLLLLERRPRKNMQEEALGKAVCAVWTDSSGIFIPGGHHQANKPENINVHWCPETLEQVGKSWCQGRWS